MYELDLIWGWQPALYLFLGGLGAGAFLVASALLLFGGVRYKRLISAASFAAFACVAVGLLLLLAELIKPAKGFLIWQSFSNFTSWMALGAWIALGAMICFAALGVLYAPWFGKNKAVNTANPLQITEGASVLEQAGATEALTSSVSPFAKVLTVVGSLFALMLAFYTGMLLMCAEGIALWHTPLLPALFTVSAIDTGIALVELIALSLRKVCPLAHKAEMALRTSVITLIILELVILAAFLYMALSVPGTFGTYAATAAVSVNFIIVGGMAPWFWGGVVAFGLVCPLFVALITLKRGNAPVATVASAFAALIGGCILRFVILFAGVHVDLVGAMVAFL